MKDRPIYQLAPKMALLLASAAAFLLISTFLLIGLSLPSDYLLAQDGEFIWSSQDSNTDDWLRGVDAIDETHVWAVGGNYPYNCTACFYNGDSWSVKSPGAGIRLEGVSVIDANNVWAVGGNYTNGLICFFDGTSWSSQTTTDACYLMDVSALDANHVWAVGFKGSGIGTILFYDGTSWSTQLTDLPDVVSAVSALDASHVWAVGEEGTVYFYDGTSWSTSSIGSTFNLTDVYVLDANHVWAVGYFFSTGGGTIWFYDGTSWAEQYSDTQGDVFAVSGADANHVWAVGWTGDDSKILFFDGSSWNVQTCDTTEHLQAVSVLDVNHVWAVGGDGAIEFGTTYFTVNASVVGGHGSVDPASQDVGYGRSASIDISHDVGYHIASITDNGIPQEINNPYVIDNVTSDHNVVVTFEMNPLAINSIMPKFSGDITSVHISDLHGSSFLPGAEVKLTRAGYPDIVATNEQVISPFQISCDLGLIGAVDGAWNVVVTNPDMTSACLPNGFFVGEASIYAWPWNDFGQCDAPAGKEFVAISANYGYGLALKADGSLVSWGLNDSGQCDVPDGNDYVAVMAGNEHGLALKADGSVAAWGSNTYGQCNAPPGNDYVALAAGVYHSLALKVDGSIVAWGDNSDDQLEVPAGYEYVAITAGAYFSVALKSDGSLVAWGDNTFGQCDVLAGNDYMAVAAASWHGIALKDDGSLSAWGRNDIGQCEVPLGTNFIAITGAYSHSMALKSDGSLVGWPQTGDGRSDAPPGNDFMAIEGGSHFNVSLCGTYTVTNSVVGGHGFVDPASQDVGYGRSASIDISHDVGYHIASITDNGIPQEINNPYVIDNVTSDHNVVVTFAINTYNVNAIVIGGHGKVIPAQQTVDYGQNSSIEIVPDDGYHIASISDNGKEMPITNPYLISTIDKDHVIEVAFAMDTINWYLAEGCTAGGFETWVLVQNYEDHPVAIDVIFQTDFGPIEGPKETIPPLSRRSYNVGAYITTYNVSTQVTTTEGYVVCERAMYGNNRSWGHDSIGATAPSDTWYLAEGCTQGGMETFVLVQNPNKTEANVSLIFMTSEGPREGPSMTLAPNSRFTWKLNDFVTSWNVSTEVKSNQAVVAERAMYGNNRSWGHDSIGATAPSDTWYLAEGCTQGGMETFVLVQNPMNTNVLVSLIFQTSEGLVKGSVDNLPAFSRCSYNVGDFIDTYNVSILVQSTGGYVVCERAMYGNNRSWGHDSIGATAPSDTWYLAEGCTQGGMETFVLVQNPNKTEANVSLIFMTSEGPREGPSMTLAPNSRFTWKLNDFVTSWNVSTEVKSNQAVVAERAMYGNNRSWGHDSIGYAP